MMDEGVDRSVFCGIWTESSMLLEESVGQVVGR